MLIYCIFFKVCIDEAEIEKLEYALDEAIRGSIFSKAKIIQSKIDKIKKDKMSTNQGSLKGENINLIKCHNALSPCVSLGKYIPSQPTHLMIIFSPCPFIVSDKKFHPYWVHNYLVHSITARLLFFFKNTTLPVYFVLPTECVRGAMCSSHEIVLSIHCCTLD